MDDLFRDSEMAEIFTADATVRQMLYFEAALARAEARAGIIPQPADVAINDVCANEAFDAGEIFRAAAVTGTPVIPLVSNIRRLVGDDADGFVHLGTTSQDTIDTALALQMREGIALLVNQLLSIATETAKLARDHRQTIMPGRTLLQHAVPVTFGLKAARWLQTTVRLIHRLNELKKEALALQFGGAAGTLASLGSNAPVVTSLLAEELGLPEPPMPWHAERERIAEVAAVLGIVAGAMAKIAHDLTLLQQSEVAELGFTPEPGKGTSSAMPQKRNPVDASFASAAARLAIGDLSVVFNAMAHPNERAAGEWQAEWQAIPDLFCHTSCAVRRVQVALENLVVDTARMRSNLDAGGGFIMAESLANALAVKIGRPEAFRLTQEIAESAKSRAIGLREAVKTDLDICSLLTPAELDRVLDPAAYLGSADVFVERALAAFNALAGEQNQP